MNDFDLAGTRHAGAVDPELLGLSKRYAELPDDRREEFRSRIAENQIESWRLPVVPIAKRPAPAPLSPLQERLWYLWKLEPDSSAYTITVNVRLDGELSAKCLRAAFEGVVSRHEILRTRFEERDGEAWQMVEANARPAWLSEDLSGLMASEREAALSQHIRKMAMQPFDLKRGAPLRVALLRLEEGSHVFSLAMHHIIADGNSLGVLLREVVALYEGAQLPSLPIQYGDYAVWQREWLSGPALDAQLAHWRERLGAEHPPLELPTDHSRPKERAGAGGRVLVALPSGLAGRAHAFSQRQGVTPFMTLLAAFAVLLHRYSGQDDLRIGVPMGDRRGAETEDLIGFFVNTLVVRLELSGSIQVADLLNQVRARVAEAQANQDTPFDRLVEALMPERRAGYSPLFQPMFNLSRSENISLPGVQATCLRSPLEMTQFDLTLDITEGSQGIEAAFEYAVDLFDVETIERLCGSYERILEGLCSQADARVADISLPVTGSWRRGVEEGEYRDVVRRLEAGASAGGDAVAVVCGDERVSHAELAGWSSRVGWRLRCLGVGADDRVGLCVERSAGLVAGLIGIWKSGGAFVPLDPTYPGPRLREMIADAGVRVVVADGGSASRLAEVLSGCVVVEVGGIAEEPPSGWWERLDGRQLAYVIYTSGSTGRPKGVAISHGALSLHLDDFIATYGISASDRVLQFATMNFDACLDQLLPALTMGGRVVMRGADIPDWDALERCLRDERVTIADLPTAYWQQWLHQLPEELPSLRQVTVGGEALAGDALRRWREGPLRSIRLDNLYGPTETTVTALSHAASETDAEQITVPLGQVWPSRVAYVVDGDGNEAPVGGVGELCIGGSTVARGYLGRPGLTAERFVPDRWGPGGRLYRTGDLCRRRADGTVEFLGRQDQQVKLRGQRIELGEVEAALRAERGVLEAVAVLWGEGEGRRLVAYVSGDADGAALREALGQHLPGFLVPSVVMVLPALPVMANGKLDRSALPAPEAAEPRALVGARSEAEAALLEVWRSVLRREDVGVTENFFEVGGDSILSLQIIARAREAGWGLTPRQVFEHPTIEAAARVAELLGQREKTEDDASDQGWRLHLPDQALPCPRDEIQDVYRATPLQEGLAYESQIQGDGGVYINQVLLSLGRGVNVAALSSAWEAAVARHDILRTSFAWPPGKGGVQIVRKHTEFACHVHDWTRVDDYEVRLSQWRAADLGTGFDLSVAPLMRANIFARPDGGHDLVWTNHHILLDGWSAAALTHEVLLDYRARCSGSEARLPARPPYRSYVRWISRLPSTEAWWRAHLERMDDPARLADCLPRTRRPELGSFHLKRRLPPSLASQMTQMARLWQVTLNTLLQGAWALALGRLGNRRQVLFGTTVAGRPAELKGSQDMLGLFINSLPVLLDLPSSSSIADWMRAAQRQVTELRQFEHTPLAEIQRYAGKSGEALFDSLVVFENYPIEEAIQNQANGLEIERIETADRTQFPLTLTVLPGERIELDWEWDGSVFDSLTVLSLAEGYEAILGSLCGADGMRLEEISLPVAGSWRRGLEEWAYRDVVGRLEAGASAGGDAIAVVCGDERVSHAELAGWSSRVGWRLRCLGVGADDRVGLCVERSVGLVAGLIGIWKSGGAFVPLDPTYPGPRLQEMIADAGVRVVVADGGSAARLAEVLSGCVVVDVGGIAEEAPAGWRERLDGRQLAYVIYTSGSTGRPKGVAISHGALSLHLDDFIATYGISASDRVLHSSTINFDVALHEILPALTMGGRVVMRGREAWDLASLTRTLAEESVTFARIPTAYWQQWLHRLPEELPSLRQVTVGGEALAGDALRRWREGPLRGIRLDNLYGPTETTIAVLYRETQAEDSDALIVPIGAPYPSRVAYVVDGDGNEAPVGGVGELCIGGSTVARGYLGRPGLTAERFVPDRWGPGGRLYRTGDLCRRRADGTVEFLGRQDQQVKLRGQRIELGEVEAALRAERGVLEAVAVLWGEGEGRRLVAYVSGDADGAALREALGQHLPGFLVPSVVMVLPALPVMANGKLDRSALPAPEAAEPRALVGARSEAEAALLEVWRSVLRREDVGVTENFFEVGGDSILSLQIIARAREAGWGLTPRQVFEHPTIEAAARVAEPLGQREKTEEAATGPLGLTPIQTEFFARRPEGLSHWNQSVLLSVRGAVDAAALERVLAALVGRHEALRLRFEQDGSGAWRPSIAAEEQADLLTAIDLRGDADWRDRLASEGTQVQRNLDLGRGPLLRALYARVGEDEGRLLLTAHHLAVDGVSWRVLLEELAEGLAQAERGEAVGLPPSSTPWGIWARRLGAYAKSTSVAAELGWWRGALAGADGSLPVKLLAERRLSDSRTVEWRLDAGRTRLLLQEASRAYRTRVDEALLAALARALGSWLGRDTVLVELEGHGREDVLPGVDLSRTVGWFTTAYPVALPVGRDVAATLIGVKERLRATPSNGLSFGLLARLGDGATQAAMAGLPRPQVSFNYLGQFDQSVAPEGRFGFASEASGEAMDPASFVDSVLELNGLVAGGELSLSWRYAPEELDPSVVEGLAASFGRELEALIGYCVAAPAGATAADFPLSGLGQAELAGLELPLGGIEDLYPATPVQQGLLFHSLLAPGTGMYVNQLRLTLSGELDADALREAWREAAARHAVLRTGFVWRHGGEPLQAVRRSVEPPWEEEDWSSKGDYEAALSKWRDADVARGFDLSVAPLLRLALFSRPDGGRDLIWATHHLLLDGWSAARLLDEVAQSYRAFAAGRSARLPAPARYRDYVAWLSAQPSAETWWRKQLAALEEPATLGDALGRPTQAEPGMGRLVHRLDAAESARLQAAAQRRQVTLSTLAQGAFALLLARYSGRSEVVFGVTVAGRPAALPGVERMIGLFINSLPAWVSAPAAAPVSGWLRSLQAQGTELRQYEHTPLADIQAWAGRPGEPLFDALLVFENYPVEASEGLDAEGLAVSRAEMVERSHYPLTVTISPGSEIEIDWTWDGAAFTRAMMQPLLADYVSLLAQLAGDDVAVGALGLTAVEPQLQTLAGYAFRPVAERIAARAAEAPTAPAVSCGDEALDRAGLTARSNRIAHRLLRLGVRPEERVGLCVERSAGMVAGLLGVLKAGAAYVPLDPAYPAERLRLMLDDAAARFVVADAASVAALSDMLAGRRVIGLTEVGDEPDTAPPVVVHPEQLAYVIYTSGSTGHPKGVGVSHAALDRFLASMAERPGLAASDLWLSVTSPSFDIAALELYLPLLAGARVEIARREEITDGQRLAALLERSHATVLQATPSGWRLLLEGGWQGRWLKGLCGGEALAPDLAAALRARGVELWNMYGPTETTIWSSLARLPEGAEVSLGAAIHDTTLHLLDAAGQPAPAGGTGELCIGGANLARGYLNRPGLTAASFVPDPFGPPGARLYRTGDLCRRRTDGRIEFLGRLDQQVKLRGHRIELGEVEAALRAQPGVRDAIAVLHGPKDARRIVAYAATDRDPAALANDIAALLPAAARPALIVPLEAIPATPNGKRDRSKLPDPDAIPTQAYLPPQTQAERQLAAIWSHVLNRPQISRTDNFFNIGGDSLAAMRVNARLELLGYRTPLQRQFSHPILLDLAAHLDRGSASLPAIIPRSHPSEGAPLSLAQERLWYLWKLNPASSAYTIALCIRLDGKLSAERLQAAFAGVVHRHESLRTHFVERDGIAWQAIRPDAAIDWSEHDLSTAEASDVSTHVDAVTLAPFDLERGPLLRVALLRLDTHAHVLVVAMHHIISDAWSVGVMLREVAVLYGDGSLPPLPIQYGDFAIWQQTSLSDTIFEEQLGYWRHVLGGEQPVLELPTDRPRGGRIEAGSRMERELPSPLVESIRRASAARGVTVFMTMLAAFAVLLHRYSGQRDLRIGVPIANRRRLETEGLIGFFVNTLVIRAELSGSMSLATLMEQVRIRVLDGQAHQDLPFDRLVEALQPDRSLRHTPLFQTMFNFDQIEEMALPGLVASGIETPVKTAQFDLALNVTETREGLRVAFDYATDLFDSSTVSGLADCYEGILGSLCGADGMRLEEISLPVAGSWRRGLEEWAYRDVVGRLEAGASAGGDAIAVVCGDERVSHAELAGWSSRVGWRLRCLGVGADDRVGLCVERSVGLVAGLIGIWKSGGAFVPLDPTYPGPRLQEMIADAGVRVVVADGGSAARLAEVLSGCVVVDVGGIAEEAPAGWRERLDGRQLAYVIYTSGSTGRPKGVAISHGALSLHLDDFIATYGISASDRVLHSSTINFDVALHEILPALTMGGRVVMRGREAWDLASLTRTLAEESVTFARIPTAYWQQWLHRLPEELPSLRQVTVGGEALAGDALRRWREGPLRGIRLDNLYGPTETTIAVLYRETQAEDSDALIVPIGAPYPSRVAYVVDGDGNEAPVGGVGELCIGGSTVARGYLGRPGLTAERFVPDRWGPGGRLYRTGDLCRRRADGTVEFLGRQDQQVKLRGQRIELGEVEAALRAERGVLEAVAVLWGEGEGRRLVAYVSGDADGAALREALGQHLPGFLVPSVVMVLPALPVMANGKLDRSALPAPEAAEPRALVGARSEAEAALLEVWRSVLRREDVGVTENFFEVGGDSILSLQIIARAREAGWGLTPRQVFEHPTIEAAARVAEPLGQREKTEEAATGPLGLTPIQTEFFARRPEGLSHWNQSVLLSVRGAVDAAALERVLAALVGRHEALRLRFEQDGSGAWRPSIAAEEQADLLTAIDLRGDADWRDRLASEGTQVQRNLDLGRGPLLRALYARVGEDEGRLLLTAHHLAVDGVSWRVLLEELAEGLAQAERGEAVGLPPSSTPWGIWARRLGAYAKSTSVAAELGWWRGALAGADGSLPVKLLAERRLSDSRTVEWRLDAGRTRLLLQEASRAYRTRVDEALLAALARALGSWLGRDTVLVELEGHGREDVLPGVDLSRTVGWFTTAYPVALPVGRDVAATLIGVKERLRATPSNGLSFGLLARLGDGATQAAMAGLPRPQVSFNYLGQFDQSVAPEGRFGFASEASGEAMDPASFVDSVLELNGLVAGGELSLSWRYAPEELDPSVVEGLAASFGRELEALIGYCVAAPAGATAADFPLSGLGQAELAGLELPLGGIEDLYPATPVQQGLLFHSLLAPGTGMYVNQLRLTLSGELDADALREAWREAAARHAVLRTGFVWRHGGEPLQAVRRSVEPPWEEEDWSSKGDYEAALSKWRDADVARGFDLSVAPLLRLALFSRPDGGRDLIWATHHLLLDGWSAARLLDEVAQSYRAFAAGRSARLPAPARYRDYVAWLSAQPSAETWWRKQLAALEEPATLGDALGRPTQAEPGMGRLVHRLDAAESARLQAAAQRRQVTLSTLAQGAFALLLARYSGRSEVVFGVTVAGRPAALPGVERMIGLFINSLPAWVSAPAAAPVSGWLRSLQAQGTELRQYEHTPLADIQAWAGRPGEPLFDALLVFENYPVEASEGLDAEGLAVSRAEMVERSHYPLTVTISPGSEIEIDWTWDGAAFTRAMMQPLLADYVSLLAQLAGDDVAVGALGLTAVEPQLQTLAGYAFRPVAERIAARAAEAPTAPAVSCGDEALDRAGLTARSNRIAHRLLRLGVRPEERVGLCVERSAGMVAGLLGVLKAGAAYVPLDPAYPAERLRLMLDDAAARFVVADAASVAALSDMLAGRRVIGLTEVGDEPDTAPPVVVHPEQLAYVIYTSGSTGHPKGVGVSHAALDRFLASMAERPGLAASDLWLSVTSPSFDIAALELYLPLLAGARVEIARREEITDGQRLAALLERSHATVLQATPSGWRLLLEGGWQGRWLKGLCGGEALAPDLAAALRARGVELWNMYGPTETTIWSSLARLPEGAEVSLGAAIHDTTLHLLDAAGQPAPAGGTGELCIGGANLARGYLNRPGLTAASFVPDPFGPPGARLYRTGDLCRRRTDGRIEFLGRLDQQVKLRGHRIELGEVEAALRAQPGVRDAIAVLHGPKDARRIVAYAATDRDPAALANDIAALLPAAARPALIVPLEAIPATPNGKRDRSKLPDPDAIPTQAYLPPQTQAERQLAAIWSHVLNRPQISRTDNFFNIGGDSLRALRVAALARKAGLAWVTPGSLFAHPVLKALADEVPRADLPRGVVTLNNSKAPRNLFCIHPGYGLVSEYRALAQELDGVVTVIGLESPIYTEPDWRAHDLTDLARRYVANIQQVQSEGPYALLGWSHGGLVAIAMAHCLRQGGHEIDFLGLIDVTADISAHEAAPKPDADETDIADLLREIRNPRWESDRALRTPDIAIARQAAEVIRHQDALVQGYRIPRLDVPLTVWWASRSLPRPQAQLDWTRHTSKGVRVELVIDTDHKMVVRHPELLASLRTELLTQRVST